jgi:hypothetical protein
MKEDRGGCAGAKELRFGGLTVGVRNVEMEHEAKQTRRRWSKSIR